MANQGYYGSTYDRYVSSNSEMSTISKMKETYWTTKQAVMTKLGKKQDAHIVASDAELDAKLELFRSIEQSCLELLRVIEKYQDRLCVLSREENAMGRLLKTGSEVDKTRAGKMMAAVAKAQNYSSQQLLQLRAPLVRLYQEVEVFRHRAISDMAVTVERMEVARTEYRGALMWMKDVSEVLDPDTSKQLQKFRMVQGQVKKTKSKFDRLKLDTMQKIDLLAASRSNMFSQVLVKYQSSMLTFWEKMSYRMTAVADSFKGYQYYEFNMLKELGAPSKKLAEETGATDKPDHSLDESLDDVKPTGVLPAVPPVPKAPGTLLPAFDSSSSTSRLDPVDETPSSEHSNLPPERSENRASVGPNEAKKSDTGSLTNLLDAINREFPMPERPADSLSKDDASPFIEFGDDDEDFDVDEARRRQDEEFHFSSMMKQAATDSKHRESSQGTVDLLSADFDVNKEDMTLLNDILNTPVTTSNSEFSSEWHAAFGATGPPLMAGGTATPGDTDSGVADFFMPSSLLDMTAGAETSETGQQQRGGIPLIPPPKQPTLAAPLGGLAGLVPGPSSQAAGAKPKSKKDQKAEMSAWFNLFAELDPLSNPDAIGRSKDDLTDA